MLADLRSAQTTLSLTTASENGVSGPGIHAGQGVSEKRVITFTDSTFSTRSNASAISSIGLSCFESFTEFGVLSASNCRALGKGPHGELFT